MTLQETRQLGIEVERRLQTILPTFKLENKIDTEDIYAFLNQFQKQYIDELYRQNDNVVSGSRTAVLIEDLLRTLTTHQTLLNGASDGSADVRNTVFTLPNNYYAYVRSVSSITGNYKNPALNAKVSNVLVKQPEANSVINQAYDQHRILRNPVAVLEQGKIKIIHDEYTTINDVDITYIKLPAEFSILTDTVCELPMECFNDLVAGATDLYIRHLTATQPKQQPKKQEAEE